MFDQKVRAEGDECVSDEVRPLRITGVRRLRVAQAAASHRQSTAAAPMISLEQTNNVLHISPTLCTLLQIHAVVHIFQSFTFSTVGRHSRINIIWSIVGIRGTPRVTCTILMRRAVALHLATKLHISLRGTVAKIK
jgi:hypothetical protein